MKLKQILLNIIGFALLILSILFFFAGEITFIEGTVIGGVGLGFIVLSVNKLSDLLIKYVNKKLGFKDDSN